jgi:hypothetical protein
MQILCACVNVCAITFDWCYTCFGSASLSKETENKFLTIHIFISGLNQRFPNFFQVGATFISQNVLRAALLLSPLKANCLRF